LIAFENWRGPKPRGDVMQRGRNLATGSACAASWKSVSGWEHYHVALSYLLSPELS
jgi:hypothetical protein